MNLVRLWDNILSKGDYFMDILSKLSERLNDLMNEAEIKTPELSDKTGIDQSAIARILRAERMPSLNSLTIIADFFHCSTDYLLGLSDTLDEKTFAKRPPFSEQLTFLLSHFNISKYRLEKETKLTEETVNRWHKGKYEPTIESLVRLAKYFDCSTDFILGREN